MLEVLTANGIEVRLESSGGYTPTALVSFAILSHNRSVAGLNTTDLKLSDGLVITAGQNPPEWCGIKYCGFDGGPTAHEAATWIEARANELLSEGVSGVERVPPSLARRKATPWDFVTAYVDALDQMVDMAAIRSSNLKLAVDPMGGSSLRVWDAIAERYDLGIDIISRHLGGDFAFLPSNHDGTISMNCASPEVMGNILAATAHYDMAFGVDPDAAHQGIADTDGLMTPSHYIAVCVNYLLSHRPSWPLSLKVGKTLASSALIDQMAENHGREIFEAPMGFEDFAQGLCNGQLAFVADEMAGGSFLAFEGNPWVTGKDGIVMCLLAAEILAVTGKTPSAYFHTLMAGDRPSHYACIDAPVSEGSKALLSSLTPEEINIKSLADDPVESVLTQASGNGAPIGGVEVATRNGWFVDQPGETDAVMQICGESFLSEPHLQRLLGQAYLLCKVREPDKAASIE